jgi:Chaperone of endosialidase
MKSLIHYNAPRRLSGPLITLLASCFALSPMARAVLPAPDGGYPGGNTAEGQQALLSLTTGTYNTAVGFFGLESNSAGSFNTAVGAGALLANTAELNTATGAGALLSNTTGTQNTANGTFALLRNTTGNDNTANGFGALQLNTTGGLNTALGLGALGVNTTGGVNTANGALSLGSNTTGAANTATGAQALFVNAAGNNNTADGYQTLASSTTGSANTAIGYQALSHNTTGSNNIALGVGAGSNVSTANNVVCIGTAGQDVSDSLYVGNVFETSIDPDNLPVLIDVTGRLGTQSSSRRFKDDIKPMDKASKAILALKPVTFHYKSDKKRSPRFGLIAEEVAQVDPNLVALDKEGKPYSVRYDQVNAMLLNEFLKEHGKVQELEKGMAALTAQLKEQAAQIQKMSAQLEMNEPIKTVVLDNP